MIGIPFSGWKAYEYAALSIKTKSLNGLLMIRRSLTNTP
jgi:hypothetical protein